MQSLINQISVYEDTNNYNNPANKQINDKWRNQRYRFINKSATYSAINQANLGNKYGNELRHKSAINQKEYLQSLCFHDYFALLLHMNKGTCLGLRKLGKTLTFFSWLQNGQTLKMMGEHFAWDPVSPVSLLNDY